MAIIVAVRQCKEQCRETLRERREVTSHDRTIGIEPTNERQDTAPPPHHSQLGRWQWTRPQSRAGRSLWRLERRLSWTTVGRRLLRRRRSARGRDHPDDLRRNCRLASCGNRFGASSRQRNRWFFGHRGGPQSPAMATGTSLWHSHFDWVGSGICPLRSRRT